MPNMLPCKAIVGGEFFKPLGRFLDLSRSRRNCPALPAELWLEAGGRRCLSLFQSGRDFLQDLADRHAAEILRTTFFEGLKSKRRLALLSEILAHVQSHMRRALPDPFAAFKDLTDFDIYPGDGHFVSAASHDKAAPRKSPGKNKKVGRTAAFTATKYATGHIYGLCLRSHGMNHLTVSDQVERKKDRDMRALKRQDILSLCQGAAKGRKVLYVWDRAGIGFRQWFKWKESGIYFLSREKENMKLEIVGIHSFDRADRINQGVISDEMVATSVGVTVRRVIYQDPETGIGYAYLTNLPPAIAPGIVALLHKSRASTANAKTCQARLLCLTHNLMTLMEEQLFRETGIRNEAETKRKAQTLIHRDQDSRSKGCGGLTDLQKGIQRLTQRTVKFIRWLKNHLDTKRSSPQALARLAKIYLIS
jgi:hypothetical protein